ncbi:MAG TPA: penicillin-insensitive murein endopeptidase [Gaiellales bacterium]|nr:penicillin-insensitive murein endopeptidase [Gaiellales bacterium]
MAIAAALAGATWAATRPGTTPAAPAPPVPRTAATGVERQATGAPSGSARRLAVRRRLEAGIVWHRSRAIGLPYAGRLIGGVQLPREGVHFFTWDPILHRSPDRPWRRYGTDRLVRTLLAVIDAYAAAHPRAPRVGIGDLSRPHGGDFGPEFGGIGHASHQNGLDADVYYPRIDRRERAPRRVDQIDHRLAQDLVDRFAAAGAQVVFVGPNTHLHGPAGIGEVLEHHDDHLHVRLPPAP